MRRLVTVLLIGLVLAATAAIGVPAFGANVAVGNSGAAGDCSGNFTYEPTPVTIDAGDSVTFTNPRVHNNGCASEGHPTQCVGSQSSGDCRSTWSQVEDLPPGGSFTITFPTGGDFKYRCVAHPYMVGTISVREAEPEPEPTSEPPPPSSEPEPEPSSEPEPEPSSEPEPEPTSDEPTTPASSEPSDEPTTDSGSDEPAPEETEPTEPDAGASTEPAGDPSDAETDAPSAAGDTGSEDEGDEDDDDASGDGSGGGAKALATVLLLVTGGAVWSVGRGR